MEITVEYENKDFLDSIDRAKRIFMVAELNRAIVEGFKLND